MELEHHLVGPGNCPQHFHSHPLATSSGIVIARNQLGEEVSSWWPSIQLKLRGSMIKGRSGE